MIEALRPLVAVRKLNPTIVPMPNGNFTWPRINVGGSATYMGSDQVVPQSSNQSFGALRLVAKKLAAFVPISNDLIRYGLPAGDVIIREDMLAAVAAAEDFAFINGEGTEYSPMGLLGWVSSSNTIPANATVSLANTDADLGALESALTNANVRMLRPGWIFAPRTLTISEEPARHGWCESLSRTRQRTAARLSLRHQHERPNKPRYRQPVCGDPGRLRGRRHR